MKIYTHLIFRNQNGKNFIYSPNVLEPYGLLSLCNVLNAPPIFYLVSRYLEYVMRSLNKLQEPSAPLAEEMGQNQ